MSFYNLTKEERAKKVTTIHNDIVDDLKNCITSRILLYFDDNDTYIRKSAYLAIGRICQSAEVEQPVVIAMLLEFLGHASFKVRQTTINAAGEIGKRDFESVEFFFDTGLFDVHHSPRNAVIGSIKKMGEVNPTPILLWARKFLHHPDKEVRREICHGIELRGRRHPEDILPILQELEHDSTARVRNTLIHVIGQIAYKKGCLEKVISHLKGWTNQQLVAKALDEIIEVHDRYRNFSALSQQEAIAYIQKHFPSTTVKS